MKWLRSEAPQWRWRFAIFPTLVGSMEDKDVFVWLEWYQSRQLGGLAVERRYQSFSPIKVSYGD